MEGGRLKVEKNYKKGEREMGEEKKEIFPQEIQTLIAGIFPNTKFFETKFENLQMQIDMLRRTQEDFKEELRDLRQDMNYRFLQIDKRFEQVDKKFSEMKEDIDRRFEQVDNRFEQVDKRFEQIIASIEKLSDKLDKRDIEQRSFTLKMFSISIGISVLGVLGAFLKIVGVF